MRTTAEVLVVGGGLAGSAAAIVLARSGREVVLVERSAEPENKVCGEFLSEEALKYLHALGVHVEALGAVPISAVRIAGAQGVSKRDLPFQAMSLTRKRLDQEMLGAAIRAGAEVVRGTSVECLEPGWRARLDNGEKVNAAAVFLATGKHDLRGWPRPLGRQNDLVAFKMYWRLAEAQAAELQGHVELALYTGGYAGLQHVEGGAANLCCLIDRSELRRLGGSWEKLLEAMVTQCPHLGERLSGADALLARPLAVASIPYGMVRQRSGGLWYVGDQAAVIPSFTGDGMSIALHTGMLGAMMYLSGEAAEDYQHRAHRDLWRQVGLASLISRGISTRPALLDAAVRFWPRTLQLAASGTRISPKTMLV